MESYRLIPLHGKNGEGKYAKVSESDFANLSAYHWHVNPRGSGYAVRSYSVNGRQNYVFMHRAVMNLSYKDKLSVDHINGDTLDNRRENLRLCEHSQNVKNRKRNVNNTSGFKGVSSHYGKWRVRIWVDGSQINVGTFNSRHDAANAYDQAAKKLHGEFAKTNF